MALEHASEATRELYGHMARLAGEGNPLAALFVARLLRAQDPDAEAEAIKAEVRQTIQAFAARGRAIRAALARALRPPEP